jgi:hypothetical protein
MAPLSKAVMRLGVLFFHVGIGPLVGLGPMDARPERRTRNRTRIAPPPTAADKVVFAYPKNRRAHAIAKRAHAA